MSKYKEFRPEWEDYAPEKGTYRSILKWGDANTYKEPNEMLYKLMKSTFGMTDEDFKVKKHEGNEKIEYDIPVKLDKEHIDFFLSVCGKDNVKVDSYARLSVAYGKTMYDLYRLRENIVENIPDVVVYPTCKEEIEKIVPYCNKHKIPVYVYGGGSSVTRGVEPFEGGVSLDMRKSFNKVIEFNETDQTITVEAGMSGPKLEETLNNAEKLFNANMAYTCGHFPQSFEYSSVGGWVVTRGAGQNSTYYGNIKDIVMQQEYVTPTGKIKSYGLPAHAVGPDLDEIMMGSEGAFGVLTHVKLKFFKLNKDNRKKFSYIFKTFEDAQNAAREIMQAEAGFPSVFRLSDPEETDVMLKLYKVEGTILESMMNALGYKPMERCLFLGWTEGEKGFAKNLKKVVHRICKKHGALYLTGYPTTSWEHGRFSDPYMREALQDFGIVIDTMECSVTWDMMDKVHKGVREYTKSRPNTICMTHMSHAYPQGANLYFIFIGKFKDKEEYLDYQFGIFDNIQAYGASVSHHHGVGKMTAKWVEGSIGSENLNVFRALKKHFDPNNIMNPGNTLGLDMKDEDKRVPKYANKKWSDFN